MPNPDTKHADPAVQALIDDAWEGEWERPIEVADLENAVRIVRQNPAPTVDPDVEADAVDFIAKWLANPARPSGHVHGSARHLLDQLRAAGITVTRT